MLEKMKSTTISQVNERLDRLKQNMKKEGCELCVIDHPTDLFYFTGLQVSTGRLVVHEEEAMLFVDSRYIQSAQETAPIKACLESKESLLQFFKEHPFQKAYVDGKHTSYDQFEKLKAQIPGELVANTNFFKILRSIKDEQELRYMKESAKLLWRGFEYVQSCLKEGVSEKEIAKQFEIFCLQQGADGLSFEPIIAFGPNSAMPHYRAQETRLQEGDVVLIDIGVVLNHYHSDMTRVVFYKTSDPRMYQLYQINKAAHQAAYALCQPGQMCGALDRAARQVMKEANVEELFVHSLGHGIGLETHEFPIIRSTGADKDVVLQPGMVFTIEPGLYLAGKGGVRYEDTVMVTATGCENFYPDAGSFPLVIE